MADYKTDSSLAPEMLTEVGRRASSPRAKVDLNEIESAIGNVTPTSLPAAALSSAAPYVATTPPTPVRAYQPPPATPHNSRTEIQFTDGVLKVAATCLTESVATQLAAMITAYAAFLPKDNHGG